MCAAEYYTLFIVLHLKVSYGLHGRKREGGNFPRALRRLTQLTSGSRAAQSRTKQNEDERTFFIRLSGSEGFAGEGWGGGSVYVEAKSLVEFFTSLRPRAPDGMNFDLQMKSQLRREFRARQSSPALPLFSVAFTASSNYTVHSLNLPIPRLARPPYTPCLLLPT